jgi:hypothetical protein
MMDTTPGFTAGFIGAAVVLLTATFVFYSGIGPALGIKSPISLVPPAVYRPLVWGGFWGIPLGFILKSLKGHQMAVGFLYFLAPVAALLLVFLPLGGMGLFGLKGGPGIMVHAFIVNAPLWDSNDTGYRRPLRAELVVGRGRGSDIGLCIVAAKYLADLASKGISPQSAIQIRSVAGNRIARPPSYQSRNHQ